MINSYRKLVFKKFFGGCIALIGICTIGFAAFSFDWRVGIAYCGILVLRVGYSMMDKKL